MNAGKAELDEVNLYDRLGKEAIVHLSTAFYDRVYADEQSWFRDIFAGSAKDEAIRNQWEWLVQRLGGPALYSDRKGHPGLMRRHSTFAVTEAAAERWMEHMDAALHATPQIDDDSRQRLIAFLRHMAFFLAHGLSRPGGPGHPFVAEHAAQREAARARSRSVGKADDSKVPESTADPAADGTTAYKVAAARTALMAALSPEHMAVERVEASGSGSEGTPTHFSVLVVAAQFDGMALLERQRKVLHIVAAPLGEGEETIRVQAKTSRQWEHYCLTGSWR
jgi:truncated hemoglobin YjbI/stress-induced morphogen